MDLHEHKTRVARGDATALRALRERSILARDPEGFALASLRAAELEGAALPTSERWRAFTGALDRWPHEVPLEDPAPCLEQRLARWPDAEREFPLPWLRGLVAGRSAPFARVARRVALRAASVDALCALVEESARHLPRGAVPDLSLALKTADRRALNLSSLAPRIARHEGLRHLSLSLPLRARDVPLLLGAARASGVVSLDLALGATLHAPALESEHLAGLERLVLRLNEGARGARAEAFLERLAASPAAPSIKHLGLVDGGLDDDAMSRLSRVALPALDSLDLSCNPLRAAGISRLTEASWWPALRSLTLDQVRVESRHRVELLSDEDLAGLFERPPARLATLSLKGDGIRDGRPFVASLPSLTSLDLELNEIDGEGALALLMHPSLQSLELGHNPIRDADVRRLAEEARPSQTLRALGLPCTSYSLCAELALASAPWARAVDLRASPRVLAFLWRTPDLKVTLAADASPEDVAALAASPRLADVRSLSLHRRGEHEEAPSLLASPNARGVESLEVISLGGPTSAQRHVDALLEGSFPSLRDLTLFGVALSPTEILRLAGPARLPALEGLTLSCAGDETDAAAMFDAVARFTEARGLRRLSLSLSTSGAERARALEDTSWARTLERLQLVVLWAGLTPSTRFDAPRCRALSVAGLEPGRVVCFEALPLDSLALRDVRFEPDELRALGRWTLRELSLTECGLTDEHLMALARAPWLATIERLDLSMNFWGTAGIEALAASQHLASLTRLTLGREALFHRDLWAARRPDVVVVAEG